MRVRLYNVRGQTLGYAEMATVEGVDGQPRRATVADLVGAARRQSLFFEPVEPKPAKAPKAPKPTGQASGSRAVRTGSGD